MFVRQESPARCPYSASFFATSNRLRRIACRPVVLFPKGCSWGAESSDRGIRDSSAHGTPSAEFWSFAVEGLEKHVDGGVSSGPLACRPDKGSKWWRWVRVWLSSWGGAALPASPARLRQSAGWRSRGHTRTTRDRTSAHNTHNTT